jgi:hypothetical protein
MWIHSCWKPPAAAGIAEYHPSGLEYLPVAVRGQPAAHLRSWWVRVRLRGVTGVAATRRISASRRLHRRIRR